MDLVAFGKTLRYQRTGTPDQIAADVAELGRFDAEHETKIRRATRLAITGAVGLFLGLFFGVFAGLGWGGGLVAFAVAAVGLVVGLGGWRRRQRWQKFDLVNERYQTLREVSLLVEADMAEGATVDADVDLRPPWQVTSKRERGAWRCKVYVQPWLRLRGRFLDGTRFEVRAVAHKEERQRTSTSSSGKTKIKRRERAACLLDVTLTPRDAGDLSGLGPRMVEAVKLPEETALVRTSADAGGLSLRARVPAGRPLDRAVAMMMLSLYRVVGSRRTGKGP